MKNEPTKYSTKQILEARKHDLQQDLKMVEAQKARLAQAEASIILKLIAQREQLLALQEQDE